MEQYDKVVRDQWQEGIIEEAAEVTTNQEFYLPNKGVIRESSETTKLRVVYDASARSNPASPSLNQCLNPGSPLQNKLWDVLVQQRAFPVYGLWRYSTGIPPDPSQRRRWRCFEVPLAQR